MNIKSRHLGRATSDHLRIDDLLHCSIGRGARGDAWQAITNTRQFQSSIAHMTGSLGAGFLWGDGHLPFVSSRSDIRRMRSDYDPRRQAEEAMS